MFSNKSGHETGPCGEEAVVHDDKTGMKADLWKYCMMSDLVERLCTLFELGGVLR